MALSKNLRHILFEFLCIADKSKARRKRFSISSIFRFRHRDCPACQWVKICAVHSPVSGGLAASTSVPLSRARSASRRGRARPETAFREPACIPREAGGLASANHRPRARGAAVRAFRQRHARGIARPHEVGVTRARPPRQITHAQIARRCGHGALQQLLSRIAPLSATAHLAGCGRPLPERLGHSQLALRSDSEICALSRKALAARCDALPPRRSLHTLASRTAHAHQLSQCPAPLRLHPRT